MADAGVLREFLVEIGFRVNDQSNRKFLDSIAFATLKVASLGVAVEAAAVAVATGVERMAESMETLYFMAQRTGATVAGIQAIGFAASQLGSSVGQARSSIESFAAFVRANPGANALLSALGVNTNQPTERVEADFAKRLQSMPKYLQIRYAQMFGLDYQTLMALQNPDFQRQQQFAIDTFAKLGVNEDEAAAAGHRFMLQWRDLGIVFTAVYAKIETVLGDKFAGDLERFRKLIEDNFDTISFAITSTTSTLVSIAEGLTEGLIELGKLTHEIYGVALALVGPAGVHEALKTVAEYIAAGFLPPSVRAFVRLILLANELKKALDAITYSIESRIFGKDRADAAARLRALGPNPTPAEIERAMRGDAGGGTGTTPTAGAGLTDRAQSFMSWARTALGLSPTGAAAVASNFAGESGIRAINQDPRTLQGPGDRGGIGYMQATGSRYDDYLARAREWGLDPHSDAMSRKFFQYEITKPQYADLLSALRRGGDPNALAQQFYSRYEAGGYAPLMDERHVRQHTAHAAEFAAAAGNNDVALNQTNNITIHGAGDPHTTGIFVSQSMDRSNADAVRNLAGAVR